MQRLTRRQFALGLTALSAVATGCDTSDGLDLEVTPNVRRPQSARAGTPPNIVCVILDQLRAQALSLHGEINVETPNIDALLGSGAWFSRAYTPNPVCGPARASLVTGLYPEATRVIRNKRRLPRRKDTLADTLGDYGYDCAWVGKWHLTENRIRDAYVQPADRGGFDDYFAGHNNLLKYRRSHYFLNDDDTKRHYEPHDIFEPEGQNDLARAFLETTRRDTPFCLAISYGAPHPNAHAPHNDWSKDLYASDMKAIDAAGLQPRPNVPEADATWRAYMHGYYAAIYAMDRVIGELVAMLEELGLREDTVIVFTSDHGDHGGSHGRYNKGEFFEESVGVPLGFSWPGVIAPQRHDYAVTTADIVPTLLGLIGLPRAASRLHGRDLSAQLLGLAGPREDGVLVQGHLAKSADQRWAMVVVDDWKFVRWHDGRKRLVNLADDPYEQDDLIDSHAMIAVVLETELERLAIACEANV